MALKITDRARKSLRIAGVEASRVGARIRAEHLLLGLMVERSGLGPIMLQNVGVTEAAVRELCAATATSETDGPGAAELTRAAEDLALRVGDEHVGTEHLLLVLLDDAVGGRVTAFLRSCAVDLEQLRRDIGVVTGHEGAFGG